MPKKTENSLKTLYRILSSAGCLLSFASVLIAAFQKPIPALLLASLAEAIVLYSCSAWISGPVRIMVRIIHVISLTVVLLSGWALLVILVMYERSKVTTLPAVVSCVRPVAPARPTPS